MQEAGVVPHGLGQRIQEGDDIMANPLFQPGDVLRVDPGPPEAFHRRPGDLADLGPALRNDELDPQPQLVALRWGEDLAHLRVSVPRDQTAAGLLVGGGPSVTA